MAIYSGFYPLKPVIFHSYVSLPEGRHVSIGILWASVGRLSRPFGNVCIRQTKVASVWPKQTEQTKQTSFGKMVL